VGHSNSQRVPGLAHVRPDQIALKGALSRLNKATNPQTLDMNFNGAFLHEDRRILN
jgi:hypothetical protein